MTEKSTYFLIIVVAIALISVAGLVWFTETGESIDSLSLGITNVSSMEIRGLLEGTREVAEIELGTSLPEVPEKMMVYKVDREIPEEEISRIAAELDFSTEYEKKDGNYPKYIYRSDLYTLKIEPTSGTVVYDSAVQESGYTEAYIEKYLPSDLEAQRIADEFLDSHNLRPEGAIFSHVNHDIGYFSNKTMKVKNSESINIWYKHSFDGYQVLTDKMYIQVGVGGTIRHLFIKWTGFKPYDEYPVIPPNAAVEYLHKTGVLILDDIKNPEKAIVNKIYIGYIDETQEKDLSFMIPVYVFEGVVEGSDGNTGDFYQWIPATPEFAAEIT